MKNKTLLIAFGLSAFLLCQPVQAQKKPIDMEWHVEVGADAIFAYGTLPDGIRNTRSDYFYDYNYSYDRLTTQSQYYVGFKPELFFLHRRLAVATGVRFAKISSSITPDGSHFYYLFKTEGLDTYYLRLNRIKQSSLRVGIPLEVSYYLSPERFPVRVYAKMGGAIYLNLSTRNRVSTYIDQTAHYAGSVASQIDKPTEPMYVFYPGIGLSFERVKMGRLRLEFLIPVMKTAKKNALLNNGGGIGINLNVQLPF